MIDFEKLGKLYLGRELAPDRGEPTEVPVLYDSKDLTTHAVCVGMTGSGKTGLCLSLLEEAAIDGIPALCIDPKGDLGNLLLTFPELRPSDFEPWIDPAEAERKGRTVAAQAEAVSSLWREGLAKWGQDGARIARFRDAVDIAIYTPGSSAGRALRVLESFDPPAEDADEDEQRDQIMGAVSGLLALLGIDPDPVNSKEHILLSNLLSHAWSKGESVQLGDLVRRISEPPFDRIGVMDLETFYAESERQKLAMRMNGLLASPGFSTWLDGEPLDIQRLLWTEDGKPRITILSIAHLSEPERMFFVSTLLNRVVSWVRRQSGTSSLRALLYMDEVFGFLPPVSEPPSKRPLLTLLKQARAYGFGIVLATQNPVDLDYKALSNCGTWFLGRLQTERDVARVVDGLEGASSSSGSSLDRGEIERMLAGLRSRVFLLHNAHEEKDVLFHTRWAMSYLRGPLTRTQIKLLSPAIDRAAPAGAGSTKPKHRAAAAKGARPVVAAGIDEAFLSDEPGTYRPHLLASVSLHYVR
ncbi:MAG: ATP-binding protein, partial [Myxococcales bacterium]|nr:ATP-binding protein [Myxococcales bacterium]